MAKKFTGIRIPEEVREKLEAYAKKDGRTLSNLILKIIDDWVKEKDLEKEASSAGRIKRGA